MGAGSGLLRAAPVLLAALVLASCYASETAVLTAENAVPVPGVSEGVYCHAENKLVPPQVTVSPQISGSLGENKCRDLYWDTDRGAYADRFSRSMVFRIGHVGLPELLLLQVQTSPTAVARYAPVAVTDGMFMMSIRRAHGRNTYCRPAASSATRMAC